MRTPHEIVLRALWQLVGRRRRAADGRAIAQEYAARPQTDAEVEWADATAAAMIAGEPWVSERPRDSLGTGAF